MIGALVRYAGMTLTLVVALGKFGVETTSIIAVLGAAGLATSVGLGRRLAHRATARAAQRTRDSIVPASGLPLRCVGAVRQCSVAV